MSGKVIELKKLQGLSAGEVQLLRLRFGKNLFQQEASRHFLKIIWDICREPMFILLFIACSLYFVLGETGEGIMMLAAIILVAAISIYQEVKSSHAVEALKQFTEPKVSVIRNGETIVIPAEELVPGDILLLEEGMKIPADAVVLQENDFTVNESVITGESMPVDKHETEGFNILYQGTTINTGKCTAQVTATGNNTVLGKLGKSVGAYSAPKTLLQRQVTVFVRRFALFGFAGFIIIFVVNYFQHDDWVVSLLFALTLAMSAIPEEIPVAFSSFMALGAYKMSRFGIISRQPQVVENLGAVSVICLDKTGTITENKMQVKTIYDYENDQLTDLSGTGLLANDSVLRFASLASEKDPFDAMEKAIWEAYYIHTRHTQYQQLEMIFEYPLQGQPPMMTHVYEYGHTKMAAAKGAAEKIIEICHLNDNDKKKITGYVKLLASKGYRVIGVAGTMHPGTELPDDHHDFNWKFEGLIAFYDPPKSNITRVMEDFYKAKIQVKLVTGDYPETAMNIAGQTGIEKHSGCLTGEEVMAMQEDELRKRSKDTNVFARMFPDAKLKLIEALKGNGEIVAMTGDGVNDGPALKSASIGIAMGKKGTEIARQAADLILTDDNLERIVIAIREGRKIFSNLKKALRYIISIHIPIIFVASLPLIFGWEYPNIFTPVHVIFLELIMGPTCSVFFEREPVEESIMRQFPRDRYGGLFTKKEVLVSIMQGLIIAIGALLLYYFYMNNGAGLSETRTIVFSMIIISNVFLTFVNRSFTKTIYYTSRYRNSLAPWILIISVAFLAGLHFSPVIRELFKLAPITPGQFGVCFGVAFASVLWFEVFKTDLLKLNK